MRALLAEIRRDDRGFRVATTAGGLSRGGVLSAELLVSLLLHLVADAGRNGYQTLLDDFWDEAQSAGIELPSERAPAAASFCNARRRLRPEVVLAVLRRVTGRLLRWRRAQRRFFAVDGSRQHVQRSEELWRECGGLRNSGSPQVQISVLFELDEQTPLNVEVGPFDASERDQCLAHLPYLRAGDVLVLDRGYPGFGLLWEMQGRRIDFAVRAACSSTFPALERFLASGRQDAIIEIAPSASFRRAHPKIEWVPLRVRAVRLKAHGRADIVILTSLTRREFPRSRLAKLYRRRWKIEEYYKLIKSRHFGSGQLHAKNFAGVKQELFAQALFVAITRLLAAAPSREDPTDRARYPVHFKAAIKAVSGCLVELLLGDDAERIAILLARLRRRIHRRAQPPRPGRRFPRRSFLPSNKWCCTGPRRKTMR